MIFLFVMYAVLVLLESLSITKHAVTRLVTITAAPMFLINVFFLNKKSHLVIYIDLDIMARNLFMGSRHLSSMRS